MWNLDLTRFSSKRLLERYIRGSHKCRTIYFRTSALQALSHMRNILGNEKHLTEACLYLSGSSRQSNVADWLWRGFGLIIEFIEHLQIVSTSNSAPSLIRARCNSLQQALSLFGQLCLYRLPGNGFQRRSSLSFLLHDLACCHLSHN
jgi:hypothetical protein